MSQENTATVAQPRWVTIEDYVAQGLLKSKGAVQWFLRQHREQLINAGVLVMLRGRWHVETAKFDAVVQEIASAAAKAHLARLR